MKIGLLLASSRLYSSMHFDVVAAIHAHNNALNLSAPELVIEVVGNGGDYKLIQQKAQQFLFNPEIKVIVALLDSYAIKQIEPFVNATGKLLISIDPGAHVPGLNIPSPNQISLSLQEAFGSVLATQRAILDGHQKLAYITTFFDGGFSHNYSSSRIWEKAGRSLLLNYVIPFISEEIQAKELTDHFHQHPPDALLLQACSEGGGAFLTKCPEAKFPSDVPIYASSFFLEEEFISHYPYYYQNLAGFTAWNPDYLTDANILFKDSILLTCNKKANSFHVIGWEVAMLLNEIKTILSTGYIPAAEVIRKVSQTPKISPRGKLHWSETYRTLVAPMYKCTLINENGRYAPCWENTPVEDISLWEEFAGDLPPGITSRWQNMYLCPT